VLNNFEKYYGRKSGLKTKFKELRKIDKHLETVIDRVVDFIAEISNKNI